MKYTALFGLILMSGCAIVDQTFSSDPQEMANQPSVTAPAPPPDARTVEDFDTTTRAERTAATTSVAGGKLLGRTVASLGDPARPGFWIMTPLVSQESAGRLEFPEKGTRVDVTLLPSQGGSARVSLAALRLLQAPLADESEIDVFIN